MYRSWLKFLFIGFMLFLTACWDRVEIEERGFVIGAAVDFPRDKKAEKTTEKEAEEKPRGKQRYSLTIQTVVPSGLSQGSAGGSGGSDKAFSNITSEGESMFDMTRQFAMRASRTPFYPHIKVLVISEEISKSGHFANTIDYFIRDAEMRRGTKVFISNGEARKVLDVVPPNESLPAMYINSIAENQHKSARMTPPMRIGDLHEKLLSKQSFTVPRINPAGEERVKIAGAAVFHGEKNKFVGWLGEEETEGLNFLRGELKGGAVKIQIGDNLVIYEIKGVKHEIKADISDKNKIKFTVTISSEGDIVESLETNDYLNDPEIWTEIEKRLEDEIKRMSYDTIEKLQEEMKTDVIGLGEHLYHKHPHFWKSIKKDWYHGENYFSKSEIKVNAKVIVRNPGTVNQTETGQE